MLTESCQLLSTAHHVLAGKSVGMKPTHPQHPSAIWTRESVWNYIWLLEHAIALAEEWKGRTGKIHGSAAYLGDLMQLPENIPHIPRTAFVIAAPEEFKLMAVFGNITDAYKAYLNSKWINWATRNDKRRIFVSWGNGEIPDWLSGDLLRIIGDVKIAV